MRVRRIKQSSSELNRGEEALTYNFTYNNNNIHYTGRRLGGVYRGTRILHEESKYNNNIITLRGHNFSYNNNFHPTSPPM